MRTLLIVLVAIVVLGGGWYWYSSTQTPAPAAVTEDMNTQANTNAGQAQTPPGMMEDGTLPDTSVDASVKVTIGATREFRITNSGMTFTTKTLAVKKGDLVKITFGNTGGTHDFRIDGYSAGTKVLNAGQSETFEFVADKAGSFEYFCSVGNHRANGMVGTLTVTN